ncbi:DUF779 domain-containing protein [Sphaerotilus sp.]|jgi:uncharacterized protein|uniref:DUF779 domain-containing protein n=1 Tax=Sphaerotilus sp. TaxID=2093942 RepID=UPI0025FDB19F|nr:DUF779 domain-containing protein [Sphaerotilus sp.]
MPADTTTTVSATDAALALIATLRRAHPAMLLYQSGGCCEGSVPAAWAVGELSLGSSDVRVGEVGGVPFYVSATQCGYLLGQALTLDAQRGHLGTFSLEEGSGWHFVTRTTACAHFTP